MHRTLHVHENDKGKHSRDLTVVFYRYAEGKRSSLKPVGLREDQNYVLFLNGADRDCRLITDFHGVIRLGSFNASSSILFSAGQVSELFKLLNEKENPNKPDAGDGK